MPAIVSGPSANSEKNSGRGVGFRAYCHSPEKRTNGDRYPPGGGRRGEGGFGRAAPADERIRSFPAICECAPHESNFRQRTVVRLRSLRDRAGQGLGGAACRPTLRSKTRRMGHPQILAKPMARQPAALWVARGRNAYQPFELCAVAADRSWTCDYCRSSLSIACYPPERSQTDSIHSSADAATPVTHAKRCRCAGGQSAICTDRRRPVHGAQQRQILSGQYVYE